MVQQRQLTWVGYEVASKHPCLSIPFVSANCIAHLFFFCLSAVFKTKSLISCSICMHIVSSALDKQTCEANCQFSIFCLHTCSKQTLWLQTWMTILRALFLCARYAATGMMLEDTCCYRAAEERHVVGEINLHAEPTLFMRMLGEPLWSDLCVWGDVGDITGAVCIMTSGPILMQQNLEST